MTTTSNSTSSDRSEERELPVDLMYGLDAGARIERTVHSSPLELSIMDDEAFFNDEDADDAHVDVGGDDSYEDGGDEQQEEAPDPSAMRADGVPVGLQFGKGRAQPDPENLSTGARALHGEPYAKDLTGLTNKTKTADVNSVPMLVDHSGGQGEVPKIWLHQPKEPALWFRRFEIYRNMGIKRTIHRTYLISKPIEGLTGDRPSTHWRNVAVRWRWQERASAFDVWMQSERLKRGDVAREEAGQLRRDAIDNLFLAVANGIQRAQIGDMDVQTARKHLPTLSTLLKELVSLQRAEYRDMTARQLEEEKIRAMESVTQNNTQINISADAVTRAMAQMEAHDLNGGSMRVVEAEAAEVAEEEDDE